MDAEDSVEEFEENDSGGWVECDDTDIQHQNVICLFCDVTFSDVEPTFVHCHVAHSFNMCHLKRLHSLDCIAYIKLVNFVRKKASRFYSMFLCSILSTPCMSVWMSRKIE